MTKLFFANYLLYVIVLLYYIVWIFVEIYFYTTKEEEYIEEYIDYKIIINLVGNYCCTILK